MALGNYATVLGGKLYEEREMARRLESLHGVLETEEGL